MTSNGPYWLLWLLATSAGAVVLLGGVLYGGAARPNLVIGRMTSGRRVCHVKRNPGRWRWLPGC